MSQPRILTFNFHEPYLCLMARTGLTLDVGVYESGFLARPWHATYRAIPPNLRLIPEGAWRDRLQRGQYDVVIAQNENNALDVREARCAKLLVCHNRRTFLAATATAEVDDPVGAYEKLLEYLERCFEFIFISESKRDDYGIPGRVIPPGVEPEYGGGYDGRDASILRVGNTMRERDLMFDVDFQEAVAADFPNRVVGYNPGIPGSAPAESFEALLACYRNMRCMLHVTREEYEDGYNLAMLEAMNCGMPVVSLANPTSPLTDGVDGFVSYEGAELRARIAALLADRELAQHIGARGRDTVLRKFPLDAFVARWRGAIFEAADRGHPHGGAISQPAQAERRQPGQLEILLHYLASPLTTGRYFELALGKRYNVLTAGFRVPEPVLELWGFGTHPPHYRAHDIDLPLETPYRTILDQIPAGRRPDLYLWVDSGPKHIEPDIALLDMPKAAYIIDSHVSPDLRLEMARPFDIVFMAQKGQIELFRRHGIQNIFWLPLACSPELHAVAERPRTLDVAYVGSFSREEGGRRPALLERVRAEYPNSHIGLAWPEEMTAIYASAKIVVNACANRDVNMRVFEGMAAGALLITDEADGLEDLFGDGEHLVVYRNDDELFEKIAYYLEHDAERERIAAAGRELVLTRHTYDHRVTELLHITQQVLGCFAEGALAPEFDVADYYQCARLEIIPHVPLQTSRVLDVGCGAGAFGWNLKRHRPVREVVGIELVETAWKKASTVLDRALLGSIEDMELPFPDGYFDAVVCADVFEHLVEPAAALGKLGRVLADDGTVVISIPNIRFYEVIAMLSGGCWTYMDRGLMDRTHLRFFTHAEIIEMVRAAGLEVARIAPLSIAPPEKCPRNADGSLTMGKVTVADVNDTEYEQFRVFQYLVQAVKPGGDRLVRARRALEQNANELAHALAQDALAVNEFERQRIMAKALARIGQLDQAETAYRTALELQPTAIDVAGEYGILLVAMNRAREARPFLEKTLAEHTTNDRVLGAMGLVLLTEQRYEEAFDCFRSALDASYDNVSLLRPFVQVAEQIERLPDALPIVERFVEFYPGRLELSVDYARLLSTQHRTAEARDRLEMVLLLNPKYTPASELLKTLDQRNAP